MLGASPHGLGESYAGQPEDRGDGADSGTTDV